MAAAARPGPADARIPCPLCGGLIHPIAGRCKHCKGDLRALRATRPAAAATLPALNQAGPAPAPSPAPGPAPAAHTNGHPHAPYPNGQPDPAARQGSLVQAVAAAGPIPLAIQGASDTALPILPPRPTGRYAAAAPRASWKSWPVIVIILAVIAIVTAVILMVFPPGGGARDADQASPPPPAPDRMDTNPTPSTPRQPPSGSPDPWSRRGTTPAVPAPPKPAAPDVDDVDIDDVDIDDPTAGRDPFSRRGARMDARAALTFAIVKHACTRLSSCTAVDPQIKKLCDVYDTVSPSMAAPPTCAAATRCLRNIDEMSCDLDLDSPSKLLQLATKFSDCSDAMSC